MAIPGGDGSIILTTAVDNAGLNKGLKNIKSGVSTLVKAFAGLTAVATAGFVAIGKSAVDSYAEYEQLVGGVETLFKDSAKQVQQYASMAYKTAGLSANAYMQTVTSFSASLLQSLGGDTKTAADLANLALIDMSDNANKMGSDIETLKTAYAGFAKQQYMLLDNLKLGYGGTKTEMQRLLKDASAIAGVEFSIDSYADVIQAIHVIQDEMGITGTTAKEASTTIQGSFASLGAAWQNLLTGMADDNQNFDALLMAFLDSLGAVLKNLLPRIKVVIKGIFNFINSILPEIPGIIEDMLPVVIEGVVAVVQGVFRVLPQIILGVLSSLYEIASSFIRALITGDTAATSAMEAEAEAIAQATDEQNKLTDAIEETEKAQNKSLAKFDEVNTIAEETAELEAGGTGGTKIELPSFDVDIDTKPTEKKTNVFIEKLKAMLKTIKENLSETFSPTLDGVSESFSSLWENSLKPFSQYFVFDFVPSIGLAVKDNLLPILQDVTPFALSEFEKDFRWTCEQIQRIINDIFKPTLELFKTIFTDAFASVKNEWDSSGGALLTKFGEFRDSFKEIWDKLYYEIFKPVWDSLVENLTWLWKEHLSPLWEDILSFLSKLGEMIMTVWNEFLGPLVNWLIDTLAPIIRRVFDFVWGVVSSVIGWISDILGGLLRSLGGLLDFITGVFSGNWEKAWTGIKDFFLGIWDMIWGGIKGVINLIIDGINLLWGLIYDVVSGIVNGIGGIAGAIGDLFGKDWHFSMPEEPPLIPKLAQGAVLPPNKPFLAMVGDQKHGTNIEAPLDTIKQALAEVMANQGGNSGDIVIQIDGREIARAERRGANTLGLQTVYGGFAGGY